MSVRPGQINHPLLPFLHKLDLFFSRISAWLQRVKVKYHLSPLCQSLIVISSFLIFALIYTLGRWSGNSPFFLRIRLMH